MITRCMAHQGVVGRGLPPQSADSCECFHQDRRTRHFEPQAETVRVEATDNEAREKRRAKKGGSTTQKRLQSALLLRIRLPGDENGTTVSRNIMYFYLILINTIVLYILVHSGTRYNPGVVNQ